MFTNICNAISLHYLKSKDYMSSFKRPVESTNEENVLSAKKGSFYETFKTKTQY
jgi:hypothetical protein